MNFFDAKFYSFGRSGKLKWDEGQWSQPDEESDNGARSLK